MRGPCPSIKVVTVEKQPPKPRVRGSMYPAGFAGRDNVVYSNTESSPVFYNPYPEILYNFPISSNFLNNRYIDFTFIMQFMAGDFINLVDDQSYFDSFHISFIVYDLDEEELLLTSTQDVDFKKFGETLPRKINNIR